LAVSARIPAGDVTDSAMVWFPVRRFDPTSLMLRNGGSLLVRLCRIACLIVIEDVDLDAAAVIDHLAQHHLTGLAASDATDNLHMQGSNLICVSAREFSDFLPGRKLW